MHQYHRSSFLLCLFLRLCLLYSPCLFPLPIVNLLSFPLFLSLFPPFFPSHIFSLIPHTYPPSLLPFPSSDLIYSYSFSCLSISLPIDVLTFSSISPSSFPSSFPSAPAALLTSSLPASDSHPASASLRQPASSFFQMDWPVWLEQIFPPPRIRQLSAFHLL